MTHGLQRARPPKCKKHLRFQLVAGASPERPCVTFFGYAALVEQRLFALAAAPFPLLLIHEGVGACKQFDEVAQGSVGGVGDEVDMLLRLTCEVGQDEGG